MLFFSSRILFLQVPSDVLPPVTATLETYAPIFTTPVDQLSLTNLTNSLVWFVGVMSIGEDILVNQESSVGGSAVNLTCIGELSSVANTVSGSPRGVTLIADRSTDTRSNVSTPQRPSPFHRAFQKRSSLELLIPMSAPASTPIRPSTCTHILPSSVIFRISTLSGPLTTKPRFSTSSADMLDAREE